MGFPVYGIIALVISTALLVWVAEKNGNPAQKFGKFVAWAAIILSTLLLIGQLFVCQKMCRSGMCGKMMMGGAPHMMMQEAAPPADPTGK